MLLSHRNNWHTHTLPELKYGNILKHRDKVLFLIMMYLPALRLLFDPI